MTIHNSFLNAFAPLGTMKHDDQSNTEVSQYLSGVEQVAAHWDRPKRGYELSVALDPSDNPGDVDALLWLKRNLNGRAGRLWVPEPTTRLLAHEFVAQGDGSSKAFLAPCHSSISNGYFYVDGVQTAPLLGWKGNELTTAHGRGTDHTLWSTTNLTGSMSYIYRWLWLEQSQRFVVSSNATFELESVQAQRVYKSPSSSATVYATVALRGDLSHDVEVGIRTYNPMGVAIETLWGSAQTIEESDWTLVGAAVSPTVPPYDFGIVIRPDSGGAGTQNEVLYVGGANVNAHANEWFDPTTCPTSIQFASAPAALSIITMSGRTKLITKSRVERDNLAHVVNSPGHVSIGRLATVEVIE